MAPHRAWISVAAWGFLCGCGSAAAGAPSPKPEDAPATSIEPSGARPPEAPKIEPGEAPAKPGLPPKPSACAASVDELSLPSTVKPDDRRLFGRAVVVVDKTARRLMLFENGRQRDCWPVGLGFSPRGHKQVEGDGKTPEGWYRTSDKPWSSFDDAIAVHYPNAHDARAGAEQGRISGRARSRIAVATRAKKVPSQHTALGGAILIHGGGASTDWTLGCIALDDGHLVDLREQLPRGMKTNLLVVP